MRYIFFGAILGFLVGVVFVLQVGSWGLISRVVCYGAGACVYFSYRKPAHMIAVGVCVVCVSTGLGGLRAHVWNMQDSQLHQFADQEVVVIGQVRREPDRREGKTLYRIRTNRVVVQEWRAGELSRVSYPISELIEISAPVFPKLSYGDLVAVSGTVVRPEPFRTDTGRTFAYDDYLAYQGISYRIPQARIHYIDSDLGGGVLAPLYRAKHAFLSQVNRYIPQPESALAAGILLGVKESLGEALTEKFIDTGIIHIVVLSGYNVTIIAIFITWLARRIYARSRWVPFSVSLLAISCFALLVGADAPVLRASIMAGIALLAYGTYRTYAVLRALGIATVVMVMLSPAIILHSLSFQLSVVATLGLIIITPYLETLLHRIPKIFELRYIIAATLATQIAVLPILITSVGKVSLVAPIVNVLILPLVPHAMLLSFLTGVFGFVVPPVAAVLSWGTYGILHLMIACVEFFASWSFASLVVPRIPVFVLVGIYLLGGIGIWYWQKHTSWQVDRQDDRTWW